MAKLRLPHIHRAVWLLCCVWWRSTRVRWPQEGLMDRSNHWESVYRAKAAESVSWFQARPDTSLALLHSLPVSAST